MDGALEDASEHPIGRAVARHARARGRLTQVHYFAADGGNGVS